MAPACKPAIGPTPRGGPTPRSSRPTEYDRDACLAWFHDVPQDTTSWTIKNSGRADLGPLFTNRFGRLCSHTVLPVSERTVMRWNGDPYLLDGGSEGLYRDDGTAILLPYWMGATTGCSNSHRPSAWQGDNARRDRENLADRRDLCRHVPGPGGRQCAPAAHRPGWHRFRRRDPDAGDAARLVRRRDQRRSRSTTKPWRCCWA